MRCCRSTTSPGSSTSPEVLPTWGGVDFQRRHGPRHCRRRHSGHRCGSAHRLTDHARASGRHPPSQGARWDPADRTDPEHQADMAEHDIDPIDLVVGNLYPFGSSVADFQHGAGRPEELIDIGGPAMVRAAAKNHAQVGVVVDPSRYDDVLAELAPRVPSAMQPAVRSPATPSRTPPPTTPQSLPGSTRPPTSRRRCPRRSISPSNAPTSCATARTRTNKAPVTDEPISRASGMRSNSTAA